ncbi:MAG: Gldg family protein [Planctomycetota bacterium]
MSAKSEARGPLQRIGRRFNLWLSALLVIVVWALVVLVANRPALKVLWDVTPQQRFSISEATEKLLRELRNSGLEEPVRLEAFFGPLSDQRTALGRIEGRVRQLTNDLLDRYDELGGEQIQVDRYDLRRDLATIRTRRDELKLGALDRSVLVVSIGKRRRILRELTDLADINVPGGGQRLPGGVLPQPRLEAYVGEEAVSTALRTLMSSGRPKIYLVTAGENVSMEAPVADSYSNLLNILKDDGFELATLAIDAEARIPDDAKILAFLEPGPLLPRSQDRLLQFLREGGRVFFNPVLGSVDSPAVNPRYEQLQAALGFELRRGQVCEAIVDNRTSYLRGGPDATRLSLVPSVHPVLRPLRAAQRAVEMRRARVFDRTRSGTEQGLGYEPILQTTRNGYRAPFIGDQRLDYSLPPTSDGFGPQTVGAAFEWRDNTDLSVSEKPGRLLLFTGHLFVNGEALVGYNGDLALNIFNWLADRTELVTVRGNKYRPQLLEVRQPQVEATGNLLIYWVPGGLLLLVVIASLRRRSR